MPLRRLLQYRRGDNRSRRETGMKPFTYERANSPAQDARHRPARRGDPEHALVLRPARRGEETAAAFLERDRLAIGREARTCIMAGLGGDVARRSAGCGDGADVAEPGVGPADEHDRTAVARPGGPELELALLALDQPARLAPRHRLQPELAERLEHHLAPVGRDRGPARHLRL